MALQHLRSSTANKRPLPAGMGDGQLAINTNLASPGIFFKDSNGDLVKAGPVHVGSTAPNVSPAAGGQTGNTTGELWLDTSLTPNELKTWSGSAWVSATGQEIPVSKLIDGAARQLLQTDAAGTGVEWTSNVDVPGTLDVTGAATFDSSVAVTGALTKSGSNVVTVGDTGTVTSTMLLDGTIVNADVNASAAIAGTKISPDFGSQNVATTGTATAAALIPSGSSVPTNGVYLPSANNVAISSNGVGRLFIDASGNVGVGVSSPAALVNTSKTAVADSTHLLLSETGTTGSSEILIKANNSTQSWNMGAIGFLREGVADSFALRFFTAPSATNTERMRLDSSGRLGLGTSTPNSLLQIGSLIESTSNVITFGKRVTSSQTNLPVIGHTSEDGTASSLGICATSINGSIQFYTGNDAAGFGAGSNEERLRITSDGRVGIGTTAPVGKFVISDGGANGLEFFPDQPSGNSTINSYNRNIPGAFTELRINAAVHKWDISSTEAARIDSSGRLLVGTSSDSGGALLQVNGDRIRIASAKTPASASATGTAGEICWDADYIYVCTATDTWKRSAISTW